MFGVAAGSRSAPGSMERRIRERERAAYAGAGAAERQVSSSAVAVNSSMSSCGSLRGSTPGITPGVDRLEGLEEALGLQLLLPFSLVHLSSFSSPAE